MLLLSEASSSRSSSRRRGPSLWAAFPPSPCQEASDFVSCLRMDSWFPAGALPVLLALGGIFCGVTAGASLFSISIWPPNIRHPYIQGWQPGLRLYPPRPPQLRSLRRRLSRRPCRCHQSGRSHLGLRATGSRSPGTASSAMRGRSATEPKALATRSSSRHRSSSTTGITAALQESSIGTARIA